VKVATWNVNGVRARETQLLAWIAAEAPDVLCLQELKANPAQIPAPLLALDGYDAVWHGERAYSGVGLLVRKGAFDGAPEFVVPDIDVETRIVTARLPGLTVASVYVPNGGKDYPAKLAFLEALERWTAAERAAGRALIVCGDLNVARTDLDVHPKERKAGAIGQRADERDLLEKVLGRGLVDVTRAAHPDAADFFTWWAPWRSLKERNIGWRIDFVLASPPWDARTTSVSVQRTYGTSDHAPLVAVLQG